MLLASGFENPIHQHPFFSGLCPGEGLLVLPHELLPIGNFGIGGIKCRFFFKGEIVICFQDHEHPVAGTEDFNVLNARVNVMLCNFWPSTPGGMVVFVFLDHLGIVYEVKGKAKSLHMG